jgi:hypothetical protein
MGKSPIVQRDNLNRFSSAFLRVHLDNSVLAGGFSMKPVQGETDQRQISQT